jgi:HEAT repeat protein/5S rRNA maturation endonuclease (ribonuclease M5)
LAHVFISYVHQNRDVVDRLAKELRNRGVTVWLDRDDIEPGARWRDAIKKAIQTGKFFVACFSREYSERNQTHMNEELTLAIDELRARPSEKTWFLPVLINETHIPSRRISSVEDLRDIQAVKLHEDWDMGINRILRVLQQDDPALARIWHLVHIVEGPFDDERLYSIQQLGAIRATEKSAISALIKAAEANKSAIRQASLEALGRIGPAAAGAVPALAAALKDPKESVRRTAAVALAEIGPAAAGAVPALVAALKDPDKNFRWHVTGALWKIGPGAVPALIAALKDPDEIVRQRVADALGRVQGKSAP